MAKAPEEHPLPSPLPAEHLQSDPSSLDRLSDEIQIGGVSDPLALSGQHEQPVGLIHPAMDVKLAASRNIDDQDQALPESTSSSFPPSEKRLYCNGEEALTHPRVIAPIVQHGFDSGIPDPTAFESPDTHSFAAESSIHPQIIGPITHHGFDSGIADTTSNEPGQPSIIPEKGAITYPGSNQIYPLPHLQVIGDDSPEYSTYDQFAPLPILTRPAPSHTRPSTTPLLPVAESPTDSTHNNSLTATSTATSLSASFEEKPNPLTETSSLDSNGFTASELAAHRRSLSHLRTVRTLIYTRLVIRFLSILLSCSSFILILTTCLIYRRFLNSSQNHHSATDPTSKTLSLTPSKIFASIGGIFTLLSLTLNVACCFSKRMRNLSPVSNVVFAVVSIAGISAWLSGCFYLRHGNGLRNMWYYVCNASETYGYTSADNKEDRELNVVRMCQVMNRSWDMGILQAVFEILTLLNVLVTVVAVRWGWISVMRRGGQRGQA